MARLIDIDDERFWDILFKEACVEGQQAERIKNELEQKCLFFFTAEPTVDAVPVVHGYWTRVSNRPKIYIRSCSICNRESYTCFSERDYNFCPWCGAKMDGGNLDA